MSTHEWRPDPSTLIVLRDPLFSSRQVELNDNAVEGEWQSKKFGFALPDGRSANIALKAKATSGATELSIDGKIIPEARFVPGDLRCPSCNASIELLDQYCGKCGHALGPPTRFMHTHRVRSATTAIVFLAVIFALFGIVSYALMSETTEAALTNLSQFEDDEPLEPIDGVSYTAGELRKQVIWEHRGLLVVNLILSGLMIFLAWWSRRRALAAILIATAVYVVMQVLNAIADPLTLVQGIIWKIIIIGALVKGIQGALSART